MPKLVADEKELELYSIGVPTDEIKKLFKKDRLLTSDIYKLDSSSDAEFKKLIQYYVNKQVNV